MRKHVLSAVLVTVVACAAIPAVAGAHASVTSRTPGPNSTSHRVTGVQLRWNEAVVTGKLSVYRGVRKLGGGRLARNKASISMGFPTALAKGKYIVRWSAVADDGHRESGSWSFSVR
ncbi:MAG: copper resistance protein CopC [Solirubrobacterales bacterium]|nr:copper resistance protein CopC [Solirubrobacterales bacterium]